MANGISDTALATSATLRADGVEHRIELYMPLTGRASWTPTDVTLAIPGGYYHVVLSADAKSNGSPFRASGLSGSPVPDPAGRDLTGSKTTVLETEQ